MSVTRILLIAIVSFTAACDQAPTRPTAPEQPPITTMPPNPSPSPTPGGISGTWVRTFDTSDAADCATNTPASASFTQDANRVRGTLNAVDACGLAGGAFEGVLEAGNLRGALNVGALAGEATGTLSEDGLELQTTDLWDPTGHRLIPAGVMHLHRQ